MRRTPVTNLAVSEITTSVACIEVEKHNFIEIGSYLYQASAVVMEMQTAENSFTNATQILQSLSKSIGLAKKLVTKFQKGSHTSPNPKVSRTIRTACIIKDIGEDLSSTPASTYGDQEYAEIAVQSLSKEMKDVSFEVTQIQLQGKKELERVILASGELAKKKPAPTETDLYSINVEVSIDSTQSSDIPHLYLVEALGSTNGRGKRSHINRSMGSLMTPPQMTQHVEPLYDTFFCPLTKEIMDDPVTIESGVTYEKKAVTKWYEKFENPEDIVCPKTGQKLVSRVLSTNMALKATIEEWKERNEVAQIKVARAALSRASTESMAIEALKVLQSICHMKPNNKIQICSMGMLPLIIKLPEYRDRQVRCATLELLLQLVKDDDEGKKIGSVTGGILMLIAMKYKQSSDAFASEKADEILRSLERSPDNVKRMAENGLLDPLLNNLIKGSEEMKMEMASYLGEIFLGDSKTHVAERASPALIKMVNGGNSLTRKAAFKALKQISSHHPNSKVLVEAGIVRIMVEYMFTQTIYNVPMTSKKEAAAVLANILESGLEPESLPVNSCGHTMASDFIVHNIIYLLKNSTLDELNINLIRIVLCLTKSPKLSAIVVSVVKETETSYNLIELINNPNEEIGVAAIKLLITLSPHMGHTLVDRLCKTSGQPESLIQSPTAITQISEKHAVSANLLAKLPHQNLMLNLALLNMNIVPTVLQKIVQMQISGTRTSSDKVQRLSAFGSENLSTQSINLSKPPKVNKPKYLKLLFLPKCASFSSSKSSKIPLCPVHRGACSSQDTFCLLDAKAVERLLACLDHENVEVVEAALSAICTLLDDRVDVDKSVTILNGINTIPHVLNVVREHKAEGLWKKSFWVIERFLMKGGDTSASDISQDRLLPAALVSAFHHGDGNSRQMAENILRYLNKMPNFTANHTMSSIS
ncbi:U-box domain-containing protein [Actinidia chinensis var. chinensis]|uniref:RING-type E3 ubiquitin transferase n=1 Tax=Actinidia chinensis var. chinensis TaxID=1590841 RepID=A0A2R6PB11_ACTCC|nr:U-box domain-containing protein [Actinidia chinensis var. chinensis]